MKWLRASVGIVMVLAGVLWIGQGLNLVPGSFMTGQPVWAVLGLLVGALGAWLLWGLRDQEQTRSD
jgi:hypothetical protein